MPFVVRPTAPRPLLVVDADADLRGLRRPRRGQPLRLVREPAGRATAVSFDRPFDHGWGAGDFFNLDFPLVVWLEDHGYDPAYADRRRRRPGSGPADRRPGGVFSGHAEYWTRTMRDAADAAAGPGREPARVSARTPRSGRSASRPVPTARPTGRSSPPRMPPSIRSAQRPGGRHGPVHRAAHAAPGRRDLRPGLRRDHPEACAARPGSRTSPRSPRTAASSPGDRLVGLLSREVDAASTRPGARLLGLTPDPGPARHRPACPDRGRGEPRGSHRPAHVPSTPARSTGRGASIPGTRPA